MIHLRDYANRSVVEATYARNLIALDDEVRGRIAELQLLAEILGHARNTVTRRRRHHAGDVQDR